MCVNRPVSSAVRFYQSNPTTYYLRASIFLFYRLYCVEVEPIEVWVRFILRLDDLRELQFRVNLLFISYLLFWHTNTIYSYVYLYIYIY